MQSPSKTNTTSKTGTTSTAGTTRLDFSTGLIEGFYGHPWPEEIRLSYPKWLKTQGFSFYIYAPKNDPMLRKTWRNPHSPAYLAFLARFGEACRKADIIPGIGFTPLGATTDAPKELPLFRERLLSVLDAARPGILALLFDDLKIDNATIAQNQNILLQEAADICSARGIRLITCPTFYTPDPILEKVFGKMPENYYRDLLSGFSRPEDLDIFWTGPKVISENYPAEHLKEACDLLGRKPFIWDNYPVNDGKKAAGTLKLAPFTGREHIMSNCSGIAINPMKEPILSLLPLCTLADALGINGPCSQNPLPERIEQALNTWKLPSSLCLNSKDAPSYPSDESNQSGSSGESSESGLSSLSGTPAISGNHAQSSLKGFTRELIELLQQETHFLANTPLETWTTEDKNRIKDAIKRCESCQAYDELCDFIAGKYAFDPACLTG